MNIFKKSAVLLLKTLALAILAYLFVGIFFAQNKSQLIIGLFILIFITLPTIFAIFFTKKYPGLNRVWKVYRIFYVIFIVLYIIFSAWGIIRINEQEKTQKAIDFINSKKITLDDVMGKNLPPAPDQKLNDATIAGIDANNNYIRDDVELAIFKEYPNSAKIRAAELQYAQALQLELTQVFNSPTLVAVMKKESSAGMCVSKTIPPSKPTNSRTDLMAAFNLIDKRNKEVNSLVINISLREEKHLDVYKKYMAGYASPDRDYCDINTSSLSN